MGRHRKTIRHAAVQGGQHPLFGGHAHRKPQAGIRKAAFSNCVQRLHGDGLWEPNLSKNLRRRFAPREASDATSPRGQFTPFILPNVFLFGQTKPRIYHGEKGDSPHLCEAPFGPFRQMGTVPFFPPKIVQVHFGWPPSGREGVPQWKTTYTRGYQFTLHVDFRQPVEMPLKRRAHNGIVVNSRGFQSPSGRRIAARIEEKRNRFTRSVDRRLAGEYSKLRAVLQRSFSRFFR